MTGSRETILQSVRRSLGRTAGTPLGERPEILPPRPAGLVDAEIDLLFKEISALSGITRRVNPETIETALLELVKDQDVKKATLWPTPGLAQLKVEEHLRALGVEIVSPHADKKVMALCDLGVTEADFALPETGTIGLLSSPQKPRAVSLLPRVHLAIISPVVLRADLHHVFSDAKNSPYMIFITGPSRTADIELTVTLGVHGPKVLYVWSQA